LGLVGIQSVYGKEYALDFIGLIVRHGYWIVLAVAFIDQFGAPVETIRRALLRDSRGNPSSPLGAALDLIVEGGK